MPINPSAPVATVPTVPTVLDHLVLEAAAHVLRQRGVEAHDPLPRGTVQATANPEHGDYQSNLAFRLSKVLRAPPRANAEALYESLPPHPAVDSVEVAGPGFLNFRIRDDWLAESLARMARDPAMGVEPTGGGQRVVIDFGAPNVAKRMHVGHLRSTVIGAALAELHRVSGYEVVRDNHIGDWGTHFGKLLVAWRRWGDAERLEADPIGELEALYVRFVQEARTRPELEDSARQETARLQAGDPEHRAVWSRFVEASLSEFEQVYDRLGIRFDEVLGESFYQDRLHALVEDLLRRGIAVHDEGAVIIPFERADGKGLADTPMLIRKRDGAALYATTDLATIAYRQERWEPDRILYVTDTRQQLHFRQLFAAARKAHLTEAELVHVWFGMLTLPEGSMSTRKGNVIRLVELLDEAARRARKVVDTKSPHLSESEREEIAEVVGVNAVRYADLSQNPQSEVTFHWDRMLSLEGNTAPFLLYGYARCRSLQRKAGCDRFEIRTPQPDHPLERNLVLMLRRYPEAVAGALATCRPNLLCDYLYQLTGAFNRFYYELPVLRADPGVRESRKSLVQLTADVLERGLDVLRIPVLERI